MNENGVRRDYRSAHLYNVSQFKSHLHCEYHQMSNNFKRKEKINTLFVENEYYTEINFVGKLSGSFYVSLDAL